MEALIIIDMQEEYIGNQRGTETFDSVLEHINYVSKLFRDAGRPVIVVRDLSEGDGEEFNNAKELHVESSDLEILKYYSNSFWQTALDEKLKELNVDFLVLAGTAAEFCVTATYFGALERDYETVILQSGVLSATKVGLEALNETRPLISYKAIRHILKK